MTVKKPSSKLVFKEYTFTFNPAISNTFAISLKQCGNDVDLIKIVLNPPNTNAIALTPTNLQILFSDTPANGHQFCINISAATASPSDEPVVFENTNSTTQFGYSILTEVSNVVVSNVIAISFLPTTTTSITSGINTLSSCWEYAKGKFYLTGTGELNSP